MPMDKPAEVHKDPPNPHGHILSPTDPDNPQNWPLYVKVYASSMATAFAFVVYGSSFS